MNIENHCPKHFLGRSHRIFLDESWRVVAIRLIGYDRVSMRDHTGVRGADHKSATDGKRMYSSITGKILNLRCISTAVNCRVCGEHGVGQAATGRRVWRSGRPKRRFSCKFAADIDHRTVKTPIFSWRLRRQVGFRRDPYGAILKG